MKMLKVKKDHLCITIKNNELTKLTTEIKHAIQKIEEEQNKTTTTTTTTKQSMIVQN